MNTHLPKVCKYTNIVNGKFRMYKRVKWWNNNRIYSVNDKYFLKFKDFFFIMGENIRFSNSWQSIDNCRELL